MNDHGKRMRCWTTVISLVLFLLFAGCPGALAGVLTKEMIQGKEMIVEAAEMMIDGERILMDEIRQQREMKTGILLRGERVMLEAERLITEGNKIMMEGDSAFQRETVMRGRDLLLEGAVMMLDGKKKTLEELQKKRILKKDAEPRGKGMMIKAEEMLIEGQRLMK